MNGSFVEYLYNNNFYSTQISNLVNEATSLPTGNTIMKRDNNGRSQVENPSEDKDIANKQYTDTTSEAEATEKASAVQTNLTSHINDQTSDTHGATSNATANRLMSRDGSGKCKVATPSARDDIANKQYVDTQVTNRIPVGFIYVQYPNQTDPTTLFGGTWQNISSQYAGRFFRAEGGDAVAFGSNQAEGLPDIYGQLYDSHDVCTFVGTGAFKSFQQGSNVTQSASGVGNKTVEFKASYYNTIYGASTHVTPLNTTIRIWKRTA